MTRNRKAALAAIVLVPLLASGFALQAKATRGGVRKPCPLQHLAARMF